MKNSTEIIRTIKSLILLHELLFSIKSFTIPSFFHYQVVSKSNAGHKNKQPETSTLMEPIGSKHDKQFHRLRQPDLNKKTVFNQIIIQNFLNLMVTRFLFGDSLPHTYSMIHDIFSRFSIIIFRKCKCTHKPAIFLHNWPHCIRLSLE